MSRAEAGGSTAGSKAAKNSFEEPVIAGRAPTHATIEKVRRLVASRRGVEGHKRWPVPVDVELDGALTLERAEDIPQERGVNRPHSCVRVAAVESQPYRRPGEEDHVVDKASWVR